MSKFLSDHNPENAFSCWLRWITLISLFVSFSVYVFVAHPSRVSTAAEPHPWISDAPPKMARMIDIGQVKILEDDIAVKNAQRAAITLYNIHVQFDLRYTQTPIRPANAVRRKTSIQVKFTNPKVTLEHEIKLSTNYKPEKPWESRLLLHEMDHVAISTDPRLIKILKSLLQAPAKLTIDLSTNANQDATTITQAIEDLQQARRVAVQMIVQKYYERLDAQSNNGLDDIDQRNEFFMGLYSKEDLESLEFPYLKEIRVAQADANLESVANHYLISDSQ
ncbi:MAG: hypothetical protein NTW52_12910 [Planctomycetota bacterium]|nr:hypothetical protein [Planctomycetota bacterium]